MKKIILMIFLIMNIFTFGKENSEAKLLGISDGKIIKVRNGEKILPLASVTKMMTIFLVYEAIEKGEISENDMVSIPEKARLIGGSQIWMGKGDRLSVRDLIKATAIHSANNAAYSLAYYVGNGDLDNFVDLMNKKAKLLEMNNTTYCTPAGLPPSMTGKGMDVSTVEDIYKLSMELLKNKDYMTIASMKETTIRDGKQKILNRNKLLGKDGIYGIKTGHHDIAGYNISIVSKKKGLDIIEIVFGSPNEKTRDKVILNDLESFYSDYTYKTLVKKGEKIGMIDIKDGVESNISFYAKKDYTELLSNDIQVKREIKLKKDIEAPIEAGTVVGEYRILLDGEVYLKKDLIIEQSIERLGFFKRIFN